MCPYSINPDPDVTAKAYGKEVDVSPKHAVEVCRFLRGKDVPRAEEILNKVIEKKMAVPFKRYKHSVSHRKGKVGPGKYPVKTAKMILELLKDVKANAEVKGIDPDNTYILHLSAYRGRVTQSWFYRARGRSTPKRRISVNIEIIIKEKEEDL